MLAFLSASQDVVVDAYRTDLLAPAERGMGASLGVMGYRLAMLLSGGIAFIWTDPAQGGGWAWPDAYRFMAFLLKSMAYSSAEVGVANKVIGLWLTIGGALLGGALMLKLGLWRSLMVFGVLQRVSNLGYWWLAVSGKGVLALTVLPAFDWGFVKLATPTPVDGGLPMVVAFENLSGGMGTAAFVAFMMRL